MPHDPRRQPRTDPPPRPVVPDRPSARERPAHELKDGGFDTGSVAGEEDPGAGIDTLTPRRPA